MKKRVEILQDSGINSESYLDTLIDDIKSQLESEDDMTKEVLKLIKVSSSIIEASFEEHVGSENNVDAAYARRYLELLTFHPFKNKKKFDQSEATFIYKDVMQDVISRFERSDTKGKFSSVQVFMKCLDLASIDIAFLRDVDEADFRAAAF